MEGALQERHVAEKLRQLRIRHADALAQQNERKIRPGGLGFDPISEDAPVRPLECFLGHDGAAGAIEVRHELPKL
jgi:hypothetical protein